MIFFFKQKTAYEMRISDWSSDVCSSDLVCPIAFLDGEVIIVQVHVEIRLDQPLADPLPDDPRHFVAIDFDNQVFDLDLRHLLFRFLLRQAFEEASRECASNDQHQRESLDRFLASRPSWDVGYMEGNN